MQERRVVKNRKLYKLYQQQHIAEVNDKKGTRAIIDIRQCRIKHRAYIYSAQKRKIPFSLGYCECVRLFSSSCYYCGLRPRYNGVDGLSGIDRKDSDLGYTPDNVVPCCSQCNMAKGVMTKHDFITLAQHITRQHLLKRLSKKGESSLPRLKELAQLLEEHMYNTP